MDKWAFPEDAASQMFILNDSDLHLLVLSLPWGTYRSDFLVEYDIAAMHPILGQLSKTTSTDFLRTITFTLGNASKVDPLSCIMLLYVELEESPRELNSIVEDLLLAWSARLSDESGRVNVGATLDTHLIRAQSLETLRQVGRVLSKLSLDCEEVVSNACVAHALKSLKIRRGEISKRLIAFWESSCPIDSSSGFIWQFSHLTRVELCNRFVDSFTSDVLDEIESPDLKYIETSLNDGTPFSSSGSAARHFLEEKLALGLSGVNNRPEEYWSAPPPRRPE